MANIKLKQLLETAVERKPLKEINFGSQNAFDDYIKQHDLRPDTKVTIRGKAMTVAQARKNSSEPEVNTKPNDMFGGDYAKDRGGEAPKTDSMATVNSIAAKTGLRAQAVAGWADENGVNLSKISADIDSKKLKPMDFMTAVSGNPGNKYAKDIIAKYSQSAGEVPNDEPKVRPQSKVQDFVKNLSGKQYKEFAFDNDIDHRDQMEMQDFIESLSDEEAEEILKKYGKNESTKLTSIIKR